MDAAPEAPELAAPDFALPVLATPSVAVPAPREARPGQRACVAGDLASLRGPASGMVELPLRLFWSAPDRRFDLDDPAELRSMYEKVLRAAIREDELADYLNGGKLAEVWPELFLPGSVRRAWEERHPVLARATAAV
jgi:hypothetical protein